MTTNNFTRGDLLYHDYEWAAEHGDNPAARMYPDDALLDRNQGYEVVSLLNRFSFGKPNPLGAFQGGEHLLRDLPGHIRGRRYVLEWLEQQWRTRPAILPGH